MSVDLNKLIAKKRYLVPIEASQLSRALFDQLNIIGTWIIMSSRPKSARFCVNYEKEYARMILMNEGKPVTEENIALKAKEFEKNPIKCGDIVQLGSSDERPAEVLYIIAEETVEGCVVDTTCRPMVYSKIARHLGCEIPDELRVQAIRMRSEEFLNEVFIGGLGAKKSSERKENVTWEILINDVSNRQITHRVYKMLEDATTRILLMGWIGTELLPKLKELKDVGVAVKAITHKPSELKGHVPRGLQKGYTELTKMLGLDNVSVNPLLHGRAIIVDNKAIVGSMDFNAHSLSGEHIEFGIYTEDVNVVRKLGSYFEKMFRPLKE